MVINLQVIVANKQLRILQHNDMQPLTVLFHGHIDLVRMSCLAARDNGLTVEIIGDQSQLHISRHDSAMHITCRALNGDILECTKEVEEFFANKFLSMLL